jgi:hypothetical protein
LLFCTVYQIASAKAAFAVGAGLAPLAALSLPPSLAAKAWKMMESKWRSHAQALCRLLSFYTPVAVMFAQDYKHNL